MTEDKQGAAGAASATDQRGSWDEAALIALLGVVCAIHMNGWTRIVYVVGAVIWTALAAWRFIDKRRAMIVQGRAEGPMKSSAALPEALP